MRSFALVGPKSPRMSLTLDAVENGRRQPWKFCTRGAAGWMYTSRPLPNWILMRVDEIYDIRLLDQTFPGGRPTSSGNHIKWDKLFIRVKPADDHSLAGPQQKASPKPLS